MRTKGICLLAVLLCLAPRLACGEKPPRVVHVFVALCDNQNQGIVPVPARLGKGDDAAANLYWGARFGVKTFFKKDRRWALVHLEQSRSAQILERCVFMHEAADVFLVADAYRGDRIADAISDFLSAAAGTLSDSARIVVGSRRVVLNTHGSAGLLAYVGHDGLMDFSLSEYPAGDAAAPRDVFVFACLSRQYFASPLRRCRANPILLTTGLMAPEAYVLASAVEGWIAGQSYDEIREMTAATYNAYQKCGLKAARRLFSTDMALRKESAGQRRADAR
jgi:hypothetical protein